MSLRAGIPERGLQPAAAYADRYGHGLRMRYTTGCRCDLCRAANAAYARERAEARRRGEANPVVPAAPVRAHILALRAAGVGRRSIADVADVPYSIVGEIARGTRTGIRRLSALRILAVTAEAGRADGATVEAGPTWVRIAEMRAAGATLRWISQQIGQANGTLQLSRSRVTVRHAAAIERAHRAWMTGADRRVAAVTAAGLIAELREEGYTDKQLDREVGEDWREATARKAIRADLERRVVAAYARLTS